LSASLEDAYRRSNRSVELMALLQSISFFSCNACSESDHTQDTVAVDLDFLNKENVQPLPFLQKENVQPTHLAKDNFEEQWQLEAKEKAEAIRRRKEEAAVFAADAARLREKSEKVAAQRAQREEEARRKSEEAAERLREEEERAKAGALAAAAVAGIERRRREAARAAEEQENFKLARKEAVEKVDAWCKLNGFQDMHTQKKTLRGATKFPLHTAVKNRNQEIIRLMLIAGVGRGVRDSKSQTPSQLAATLNRNGSHDQILTMLR